MLEDDIVNGRTEEKTVGGCILLLTGTDFSIISAELGL